ncbi:MAG: hypothetical protein PWQ37_1269 [Candidatus Petromonas sp.]|jgi:galactokinase/mevalonate kinase-like predicted kinase|nr:hypothetical protein [Candidatus Petromonas sp.]
MRDKFVRGMIAGTVLGATAGAYALYKSSPRQRRRIMRRGSRMLRNASRLAGAVSSMNILR